MTCVWDLLDVDRRRTPCRILVTLLAPDFLTVLDTQGGHECFVVGVALNDDEPIVNDGRATKRPLDFLGVERSRVEHAEVLLPKKLAIHVVTVETFGAEEGDYMTAIRGGCAVRVGRLDVTFDLGDPADGPSFPR